MTTAKDCLIPLFVGGTGWATAIGLCHFSYLLAEVAGPKMTRTWPHLYDISSLLNKAEGFPIWGCHYVKKPSSAISNETEHSCRYGSSC
jgi:hypothetical protein